MSGIGFHPAEKSRPRASLAAASLYLIQLALTLALVLAANRQGLLTKEEASSAFVNPTFLQLRLQHHLYGTNFYAYVLFLFGGHLTTGLFYARYVKAAAMAFLAPIVYLYLRRRFSFTFWEAFAAALAVGLLPGVMCFSWLGVDFGLETPIGFLALWLALFSRPAAIVASCLLAAVAASSYGAGLVFLPVVLLHQWPRLRQPELQIAVLAGLGAAAAALLFPVFWWTNIQTLFVGGGSALTGGAIGRLGALWREILLRGESYYFFSNGAPALGNAWIGAVALIGMAVAAVRQPSRSWPLLAIACSAVGIYAIAGNVIGVRRAIPLVVSLGIFAAVFIRMAAAAAPRRRAAVFTAAMLAMILSEAAAYNRIRRDLSDARIALPRDFDFRIEPGATMVSTVAALAGGSLDLRGELEGYEPDRTLCILYRLTQPAPAIGAGELVERCDRHGWSIPSGSPRFLSLR